MTPEKRIWIASLLSAGLMLLYLQVVAKQLPPPAKSQIKQPIAQESVTTINRSSVPADNPHEETIFLESEKLKLEISKESASIKRVTIKEFTQLSTGKSLTFGENSPVFFLKAGNRQPTWALQQQSVGSATWTTAIDAGIDATLTMTLEAQNPTAAVSVAFTNSSNSKAEVPISVVTEWSRSDALTGRSNALEAVLKTKKQFAWQWEYLRYFGTGNSPKIVPRGTTMLTLSERYFCESIKIFDGMTASILPVAGRGQSIASELSGTIGVDPGEQNSKTLSVYFGPRDFFRLRNAGFSDAFKIGMFSRIGLILMVFLKGVAHLTHNYGSAIILLSIVVTLGFSPFTLMSIRSMRKMQTLQPRMDQLRKKYEKDPKKLNQEMFTLFKENKVSPLSGCLPMLLPLPIFFAIWSSISHVIELRGQQFLWIKDLSLPDHVATIPPAFQLNILPIIMAAAMFLQTKLSQKQMPTTDQNTKIMTGPIMPIMFGLMFYQLPSGLVLYWLTNSIGSILLYRAVKT